MPFGTLRITHLNVLKVTPGYYLHSWQMGLVFGASVVLSSSESSPFSVALERNHTRGTSQERGSPASLPRPQLRFHLLWKLTIILLSDLTPHNLPRAMYSPTVLKLLIYSSVSFSVTSVGAQTLFCLTFFYPRLSAQCPAVGTHPVF